MRSFLPKPARTIFLSQMLRERVVQTHAVMDSSQKCTFSTKPPKNAHINATPTKSIDLQSYKIKYPIHHAVRYDSISDASHLMDANTVNSLDNNAWSPLVLCSVIGRAGMCKLLIDNGAVLDEVGPKGSTALQSALNARFNIKEKFGVFEQMPLQPFKNLKELKSVFGF